VNRSLIVLIFSCTVAGVMSFASNTIQGQSAGQNKSERDYANEAWADGYHGHPADEVRVCREGLVSFPGDPDLRELLAQGLSDTGAYEEAEKLFKGIIYSNNKEDKSVLPWALGDYWDMLKKQGRNDEADAIAQRIHILATSPGRTDN